ncbi:MAG TPA: 3-phosphoshikimate 1-carboxyvinyltransferase, partial [Actinobacteria bacterium]|nr:3-phosphoshikimate 1-carboxyvinyltransferase [Actinomycetes bacterium]HEX21625.1 3-phosphoshikimate 1-carboxyvinyltransferase [Actinomycetota bacterium]
QSFFSILTGDDSLRSRPMDRIIEPLRLMGADIYGRSNNSRAPIAIIGQSLKPISYLTPVASAQVKTALLFAAMYAEGKSEITENRQSRDHTERFFEYLSIDFQRTEAGGGKVKISLSNQGNYKARDIIVAGDISSAAYFIAAGLLVKGSEITIVDVGLNPTRIGILEVLQNMGTEIEVLEQKVLANEPVGTLFIKSQALAATEIGGAIIPRLIDELPIIAVLATQAEGRTIVKDAAELRVKETDRITYLVSELRKMGAKIEGQADGFIIDGPTSLRGAVVDSHGDHRLAMSLAIAGLIAKGETIIQNAECISISYPQFEATLKRIIEQAQI